MHVRRYCAFELGSHHATATESGLARIWPALGVRMSVVVWRRMVDSSTGDMNVRCMTVRVRGIGVPVSVASMVDNE